MQIHLTIDIGNTKTKLSLFSGTELIRHAEFSPIDMRTVSSIIGEEPVNAVILASSAGIPGHLLYDLETFYKVLVLGPGTELPIRNEYRSKETLGYDRLAAAIGAWQLFPGSPVLAIVAGTCITYNLISNDAFIGGAISPGLYMRSKAMHTFTSKLPEVELNNVMDLTGTDTVSSLQSGIIHGASSELNGMIALYEKQFPGLKTTLSGGDSALLAKAMKNGIFARPNLVAEGLNGILNFHVRKNLL